MESWREDLGAAVFSRKRKLSRRETAKMIMVARPEVLLANRKWPLV